MRLCNVSRSHEFETDATRDIARAFGARVYDFPWCDDFAAARNESLRHATGDWALWLDADEYLDDANRQRLRAVLANLRDETAAYAMTQVSTKVDQTEHVVAVEQARLFRLRPDIRWRYRVHEQILLAVREQGGGVYWTDVAIEHTGYQDPALGRQKLERNLRLLLLDQADHPDDPVILFHLGVAHQQLGRSDEALGFLARSLELSPPGYSSRPKLHVLLTRIHYQRGQREQAWDFCRAGHAEFPDDMELLFWRGVLLRERGELAEAEVCMRRVLSSRPERQFTIVDPALRGPLARHQLGLVYRAQGRPREAEEQWQAACAEQPMFGPAWVELGKLYVTQKRWDELERLAGAMEEAGCEPEEAAVFQARLHMARRDFQAARRLLDHAIERRPQEVRPRLVLSEALLQEASDLEAAERALRDVLGLDPENHEARHNLTVLLHRRGRLT